MAAQRSRPMKLEIKFSTSEKILVGMLVVVVLPGIVIYEGCKATAKGAKRLSRAGGELMRSVEEARQRTKKKIANSRLRECSVCLQEVRVGDFVTNLQHCNHSLCRECWKGYLETDCEEKARAMKRGLEPNVKCPVCMKARVSDHVLSQLAPPRLIQALRDVKLRKRLVRNKPKKFKVLECPRFSCCGVAYDDGKSPTAMCFVCEESWIMDRPSVLKAVAKPFVKVMRMIRDRGVDGALKRGLAGEMWRQCPHCGMATIKNGGCSHMHCSYCQRDYSWGSLGNRG